MNEVVKRRLAGAIVLIGIAFVGVSLLPRIGSAPGEEGVRIVVIDLGAPETPAPVAAVATVPPQLAAPAPADASDDAAESADIADPGAASPDDPTTAQAQGARPAAAEPAPPQRTAVDASPKPLAAAELPSPAPLRPSLKLSEMPPPATAREEQQASTQTPPPSAPSSGSRWFVQVGGFADIRNAHIAQDRLKNAGQASIIAPSESDRGTLYRVRAGPYPSREAAVAAQAQLAGAGFAATTIVE